MTPLSAFPSWIKRIESVARTPVLLIAISAIALLSGCRKKPPAPQLVTPTPVQSASSTAAGTASSVAFERFIAARKRAENVLEVAAITRQKTVALVELNDSLAVQKVSPLTANFEATADSEIALGPGSLVVATGRLSGRTDTWMLGSKKAPKEIGSEWCMTGTGAAWLVRREGVVEIHKVDAFKSGLQWVEMSTPPITTSAEAEVHILCGSHSVGVSVRDGDRFSIARSQGSLTEQSGVMAPATLLSVESDSDFKDELRDRAVAIREDNSVVVLRMGEHGVSVREFSSTSATPWVATTTTSQKPFRVDSAADILSVAASATFAGPVWLLTSEPVTTGARGCGGGELPRRLVFHTLQRQDSPKGASGSGISGSAETVNSRTVAELPCGVEAVAAHLVAQADRAIAWWREPVSDGSCPHIGLNVGAIVEATTESSSARRAPVLAEGATRLPDGRWLTVVRPGGCVPYAAPGAGQIAWGPKL